MRFLFVDKILELLPGKHIKASKYISSTEDFFQDHFPGFPVVPGVLLTEMMAQTAGKCLDAERKPRGKAMLVQIRLARFRDWVRPDQEAVIGAEIRSNQENYSTAFCTVEVSGKKVCSAELLFSFIPFHRLSLDFRDEVLEDYLSQNLSTVE